MRALLLACALATLASAAAAQSRTQVVLLGTGTPNADPERSGPAVAVVVDSTAYLVDCGPGVVRRAAAAARRGVTGLQVRRLGHVFLTHLHSDHTLGCPDLLFSPWVLERDAPLRVWGPEGTAEMMRHIRAAWSEDIAMRRFGLEPANERGHRYEATEIRPGVVYRDDLVTVTAFAVEHGSWPQAFGYRFETPDRVVVVSGDARPSESVVDACAGCDVLVHEVYSSERYRQREPVWQRYHASFHTSTEELADIARRARPGLLVLYHQLFWGASDDDLLREIAAAGYGGRVVSGRDLEVW